MRNARSMPSGRKTQLDKLAWSLDFGRAVMRAGFSNAVLLAAFWCFTPPVPAAQTTDSGSGAQAGWAEIEITPPLGIGLGGRGGPDTVATKVLDPLFAQVTYLKDAKGNGFVLVSFDIVGLPHDLSDRLRTDIIHELGVTWNLVVLNASHTHSGPLTSRA